MNSDAEEPSFDFASEKSPLIRGGSDANSSTIGASPKDTFSTDIESTVDDITKDELDRPWPATFDRGIKILAGPIMDEKSIDNYTKSPGVRPRYNKSETHTPFLASTPAWVKRGLVKLKSLDYTFDDENTAIPTPKPGRLDAHAYRQQILAGKSGGKKGRLTTSEGHYIINTADLSAARQAVHDVTRSPGFRRERHVDKQRKHETQLEHGAIGIADNKSSFVQCTFNMANILMGVGMLGLPYVFKSAGWIGGFFVTVGLCLVTWRTSYYLGRELNGDPRPVHLFYGASSEDNTPKRMRKQISSFPGLAREAFGDKGCVCLSTVLYFELLSCLSIFLVSLGNHLHVLFPSIPQSRHMTIAAGILVVPSALLRTPKLLSYLSAVGTLATVVVVLSVVLSALVMFSSVRDMDTEREYKISSLDGLPLALGIVAYCFSGHAIVPSIFQSMQRPQEFERMIDLTYGIVLLSCLLVAISGYYMFGDSVDDQVTISLEKKSENVDVLMSGLTWLMILTAGSKFTLTMFPLALGFEEMLTGILPNDLTMELIDSVVKVFLIFLSLAVALFFPSFCFLTSMVGLICSMIVSVIFPALAHLKLFGTSLSTLEKAIDWFLVIGGSIVAIVGTIATVKDTA